MSSRAKRGICFRSNLVKIHAPRIPLLRLHHGEQVAPHLYRRDQRHRTAGRPTQGRQDRRLHPAVQNQSAGVLRAVSVREKRHLPRKRNQRLGSSKTGRPDRAREPHVGRLGTGLGQTPRPTKERGCPTESRSLGRKDDLVMTNEDK